MEDDNVNLNSILNVYIYIYIFEITERKKYSRI